MINNNEQIYNQQAMLLTFIKKSMLKTITTSTYIHRFMVQPKQQDSQLYFVQKFKLSVQNILDKNSLNKDELEIYQGFLIKHNKSIKKPHIKLLSEQERIISSYLASNKYTQVLKFLMNNYNLRLCSVNTAKNIDAWVVQNWQKINQFEKISFSFVLPLFQEFNSFNLFKKNFLAKDRRKLQKIQINELICIIYCSLIQSKNIEDSISFLFSCQEKEKYNKLIEYLHTKNCRFEFSHFKKQLINLFELYLTSNHSIYQRQNQSKKRSIVETDVQCFLAALGYKRLRQVIVNGYKVDFIVQNLTQSKKIVLEINGLHHYTITGKLKGIQIIRNLIVNLYSPLRILHIEDYNKTRGHQNKRKLIESLFQMTDINWNPVNKGFNSEWQLADEYKQLQ